MVASRTAQHGQAGWLARDDELAALATGRAGGASLFETDLAARRGELRDRVRGKRVLVIGGAGSIGASTTAQISRFAPAALHVVDLSENGLAELVRDLRGRREELTVADFRTLPLDFGSPTMRRFLEDNPPYDLVLNFAAIKHVRSEKDSYSVLHMLDTNVLKARRLLHWIAERGGTATYFCVSTDKAANPVNLMGASKRLMEHVIFASAAAERLRINSARFANVAFSDGSLLDGWLRRLEKRQPLAVPRATRRFFVSIREAGELCLLTAVCGPGGHILIPRLDPEEHLTDLERVARALLERVGLTPVVFEDERLAVDAVEACLGDSSYPLLLTPLDTSGEKPYEEFVGDGETSVELGLLQLLGIRHRGSDAAALTSLIGWLDGVVAGNGPLPGKEQIVSAIGRVVPELRHIETHKLLDQRL